MIMLTFVLFAFFVYHVTRSREKDEWGINNIKGFVRGLMCVNRNCVAIFENILSKINKRHVNFYLQDVMFCVLWFWKSNSCHD